MRQILILVLLTFIFVGAIGGGIWWLKNDPQGSLTSRSGDKAFDFSLPKLRGGTYSFKETKGRITIINFWATWCEPCQREFPTMIKLAEQFGKSLQLVLISVDTDRPSVDKFLQVYDSRRENVIYLWDQTSTISNKYGTHKLPESYIFDQNSNFLQKVSGSENWAGPEVIDYFKKITETGKASAHQ